MAQRTTSYLDFVDATGAAQKALDNGPPPGSMVVMSTGIFVTILEKCAFEFSYLPAGQTETRTIQRAVNTIPWYRGTLYANVHAIRIGSGVPTAVITGKVTNPSTTDQLSFVKSGAALLSLSLIGASAPSLLDVAASDLGPYLQFDVSATQHATTPTFIYFEISLGLLLRAL